MGNRNGTYGKDYARGRFMDNLARSQVTKFETVSLIFLVRRVMLCEVTSVTIILIHTLCYQD